MRKKMKRIIGILLAVCMIASFVPIETYAMVGALTEESAWPSNPSGIHEGIYFKYHVYWIESEYIRMYLLMGTDAVKDKNTYLVTVPNRTRASAKEAYDMVFTKGVYQRPYFLANSKEITYDSYSIRTANDNTWIEISYVFKPYTQIKKLSQKYTYTVKTKYYIVGLDEGMYSGFSEAGRVMDDESDEGTYGVRCEMEAGYEGSVGWSDDLSLSFNTQMVGFNRMGHEKGSTGPGLYMSTATGSSAEGYTHTTTGIGADYNHVKTNDLSWWSTPSTGMNSKGTAITEVLTKGYSWANPFTALSDLYSAYVYGHDIDQTYAVDSLPGYFSATKSGDVTLETPLPLMGAERTEIHGSTLWGFRGLRAMDEDSFTPNDKFTPVSISAKRLGIFKDGSGGYKAIPIESDSAYNLAVQLNGQPVAVMRGNFEEKDDRYVFSSPAALSTSITAVWSASKGSFSVGKDGSVALSGVGLNAPSFKFYQDNGGNGLSMQPGENGLEATITPASNSAVMAIDIPGTTIKLEGAVIKPNGDISFTGQSEFSLFKGADFKMEELGYGMKNGSFKINGIRATGSIESTEMIGLEMGSLKGEIDTFKNYYHFTLNLNVFDLFKSDAELELMKSKLTGSLMPNKLYFYVGSEVAKIPLVPPVVVANISGAGGGFNNLAKTLNGDFFAIPPINLTITGTGDVLHTLEATASYTFGPAYYKMEATDVNIKFLKKLNLIDEFSIYEGVQGETRSYKGTNYTGLSALGGASVHISVPHKSKVFQAGGEINASVFGGMDSYKNPTKVYVVADLNGGVEGSVHIPKGVKKIGGKKIASTTIDFYLGASSVVKVRGTDFKGAVESAFKNFRIYGGAKKEADWAIAAWRAYYIFPENDAGFTIKGFWDELPEWNWDDHKPSSYSAYSNAEEGTLMLVGMNMDPLYASVAENDEDNGIAALSSDYSKTVTLRTNLGQNLSGDTNVILMVTPDDGTDIDAFAESLTVSKDGQPIALTWPKYNENEEIINESSINAMVTTNGTGKDCLMIGLGKNASVGDVWSVTSSVADFQASLNASMPFDSLDVSLSGYDLSGKVANAEANTEYVLATYFGSKKGETEYIIGHEDMNNPNSISVTIPREGTMLPTGNYYVTTSLMKKATIEVEDEAGNTTQEEILLPVDTKELGSVSYTNTAQPDAPSTAEIKPIGNEIMSASWSEVKNADGYKVTIYQKNGDTYEDTGKGYSYDAADIKAGKINGIAYDANSKEFTLDMALTVSGEDIDVNKELQGSSTGLEADKNYKIGVQAYKYLTEDGEKIENSQVYSTETLSNESILPAYTPLDINITLKTLKGSGPSSAYVPHTVTEEDGVFTCVTGGGDNHTWYLMPSCDDENVTFTVTRMDTGAECTETDFTGKEYCIDNEEIIGSVMFKIDAAVNKGTYTDITTKYLLVEKDDTAPMFSLDETVVFADPETGAYTITGLTEPNMKVCLNEEDYNGNPIEAATADETGRFSYTGRLELTKLVNVFDEEGRIQVDENGEPILVSVPNELSKLVSLLAKDENGNRSAVESASVTVKREVENYTVTLNTNGGTISSGKELTSYTGGQGALLPNADNITRAGYTFMGWYDNEALTGDPVTLISTSDTGEKSYWAKWEAKTYTVDFDTAGGTEIASKTTAKWNEAVLDGIENPTRSDYRFAGWKCGNITVTAETTYGELVSDDTVTSVTLVAQWKDVTAPTGEIKVSENIWKTFLNKITFGLFFKNTQDVIITADDNSGDTVTIEYLLSDKELTADELNAETFNAYTGAFGISPDNEYVIYAKLTDASGNVTYINSDGIVLDSIVPGISGVENGKTYCSAQTVTITEKYIESVTLNGNPVTIDGNNQFTLPAAEGEQTIVVTDKAGNTAEVTVTVNDGHNYEWQNENGQYWKKCSSCGDETVKKDIPTITINGADTVCVTQDYEFSFTLPEGATDASYGYEFENKGDDSLKPTIENGKMCAVIPADTYEPNESGFKVYAGAKTADGFAFFVSKTVALQNEHIDAEPKDHICDICGVTVSEHIDAEPKDHICDICGETLSEHTGGEATCKDKAVCEYCGNEYGELDSTKHDLENIPAKDASVTETGNKEYWHCKVCENNFSDESGKNSIELKDTVIAKLPPEIIEGTGQSINAGDKKDLTFRSNAAFSDFIRVDIDGNTIDGKNYTTEEGSTIVTLKANYVATLSAGEHTIGIVSQSGTATTTFTVAKAQEPTGSNSNPTEGNSNTGSVNPVSQTGDNSNMALWVALLLISGGLMTLVGIYYKKKKHNR